MYRTNNKSPPSKKADGNVNSFAASVHKIKRIVNLQ